MRTLVALPLMRVALISLWIAGCAAVSGDDLAASTVSVVPSSIAADGKTAGTITVFLVDKNNRAISGAQVKVHTTDANTTIIQPNPTNSDGHASGSITSTTPGTQTLTVIATLGGVSVTLPQTATVSFTETDSQRASLYLSFTPDAQSYVADGQAVQQLTLVAHDGAGFVAVGQPIMLAVSGSNNTLSLVSGVTDSLGSLSATLSSTTAEVKTITASSGTATTSMRSTFIAGAASFANSGLNISPNSLTADGTSISSATVSLNDAFGNPIAASSTLLALSGVTGASLLPLVGVTDAQGHFTARLTSQTTGNATITARTAGLSFSKTVALTPPGPSAVRSSVVSTPFNVEADGVDVASILVQVNDTFGRPLAYWPVSLSITGTRNTLSTNMGTTDFSGAFRATLQSTVSGTKTITANLGTTAVVGTVVFLPGAPVFANSTFAADTTVLLADGNQTATLTLTARDAQFNPSLGAQVNFVATGSSNLLSPASALTDIAGQAKVKLSTTSAETKLVTALLKSTSLSAQVAFLPRGSSLLTSSFVANPNVLAADGSSTANLLLTLADASGNRIGGDTVIVTSTGTSNTINPVQGYTDANGVFASRLASGHAELKTVTASVYGQSLSTQVSFVATAVDHTHSSIVATPSSVTADGNSQIAITFVAQDAAGNAIANQPLTLSLTGTRNTLTPTSGTTDATGTFVARAQSTMAEAKTLTISIANSTFTKTLRFVPGPASAAQSSVSLNPNTQVADNTSASTVFVLVRDAQTNPIAAAAVNLSASGAQTTLSPSSGTTTSQGQYTAQIVSRLAQTEVISASFAGVTAQQNITFIAGAPSYARSSFVPAPATVTANNSDTTTLTLNLLDAQNNPVANQNVVLSVTGSQNTSYAAFATTNNQGIWTATLRSGTAQSKTVAVQVGTLNFSAQVNFVPAQAASANSTFTASPNSVAANGSSPIVLSVMLADSLGNPSTNQSVTLSGSGSLNVFGQASGTTDSSGLWSTTLTSVKAQNEVITAQAGSVSLQVPVSFYAGAAVANASTLSASPSQVTADGVSTTSVVLQAYDAQSNAAGNQNVSLTTMGTDSTILPASVVTDANGRASFSWSATVAGAKTGTINLNGTGLSTIVNFVAGVANSAHSSITAQPPQLTADGNQTSTLTVLARDIYDNPVPQSLVNLSASGAANTFAQAYGNTDASGRYTATVSSAQAQNEVVSAQIGTPVKATVSTPVRFVPGGVSQQASSLVANANQLVADGNQTTQISLVVRDAAGNALGNQAVSFVSSGSGSVLSATGGTTDSAGQLSILWKSTVAETKTLTASFAGVQLSVDVVFVPGPAVASQSSLSSDSQGLTADGASAAQLTLIVRDINNNLVTNQNVTFTASGAGASLTPTQGNTASSGQLTVALTSSTATTQVITATFANGVSVQTSVSFVAGTGSQLNFVVNPNQVVADGNTAIVATVVITDNANNLVAGQNVSFSVDGATTALNPPSSVTDSFGRAQANLTSTLAQSEHVTVSAGAASRTQTIVFWAGSPNQQNSIISANGNSVVADGSATTQLSVTLIDAFGNRVSNQTVAFASTGTNNIFGATSVTTDSQGVATTTLRSPTAQAKTVSATASGVVLQVPVNFVAGMATSAQSSLTLSPNILVADGVQLTTATLLAKDSQGNIAANQAVVFAVNDTANILSTTNGMTDSAGLLTTTLSSTHAASKTLSAGVGQASLSGQVLFVAGSPNSALSSLSPGQTSATADGSSSVALSVVVLDAFSNPIANQNVTFTSTGSANTFTPASAVTDSSGRATTALSSVRAETKLVTATFGAASASTNLTFTAGAASATTSQWVASPNQLVADGNSASTLVLVAKDAQGNLLSNKTVTLTSSGTANTLSAADGVTDANGTWSATLASTKAEAKTVTVGFGSISLSQQVVFVPGAPAQANSSFSVNPNSVVADNASTSTIGLTVRDARNNPIANQSVTLSVSGTANTLSGASLVTSAAGSISATLRSSYAEVKTVTATSGALSFSAPIAFTAGAANTAQSTLTTTPQTQVADGVQTTSIVITLRDAQNNPVANQNVTLSATGASNTLTPQNLFTDANGRTSATLASTFAETKTLTALFSGGSMQASVSFVPGAAAMANTSFVASPNSLVADGATTTNLSLILRDAQNNPIANQNVTWTSTGSNNSLIPAASATNSSGQAFATLASTTAESKTVTAQAGAISPQLNVIFVAGAVVNATSSLIANPNTQFADNANTIALLATAKDAYNNPITNLSVTFSATGTSNTFTNTAVSTDASGLAATTLRSARAEAKNVQAIFGAASGSPSQTVAVTFTAGSISQSASSLTGVPSSPIADGNSSAVLTFTALDALGNPLSNQSVTLGATGSNNVIMPVTGTTNSQGVFVASITSVKAEAKTVVASCANITESVNLTFVSGPPTAMMTSLVASPNSLTADNVTSSSLQLTVRDAQNNPVGNQNVTWSVSGTGATLTPMTGVTPSNGNLTASIKSSVAELKTISASLASLTASTQINFTAGPPLSANSSLTASPNTIVIDGTASTQLTATVRDAQHNPISGQLVSFSSTGSNNTFTPQTASTNAAGVAQSQLLSTTAETKVATAAAGAASLSTNVVFVAGSPNQSLSSFVVNPNNLPASNANTTRLTITLADNWGNAAAGQSITLSGSGSGNNFALTAGNTNSTGVFSTTLRSAVAQSETLTAVVANNVLSLTQPVTFVAGSPNASVSTLVASPSSLVANNTATSTITASVRDVLGNPLANQNITFSFTGTNNTATTNAGQTDSSGALSTNLSSTKAEIKQVTAQLANFALAANVTFVAGPMNAARSVWTLSPNHTVASSAYNLRGNLVAMDAYNNALAAAAVSFTAQGNNTTFTPANLSLDANGAAVTRVSATSVQNEQLIATVGATSLYASASFTAKCGPTRIPNSSIASTSSSPWGVIAADFNKDGFLDLAVANSSANNVNIFLGDNHGNMTLFSTFTVGAVPLRLVAADFNLDSNQDLAVVNKTDGTVSLFLGTGTGNFTANQTLTVGSTPWSLIAVDLDKDGYTDIVVPNSASNSITILYNSANLSFTSSTVATGAQPRGVAAADFNRDGTLDLATANFTGNPISVLVGQAGRSYASPTSLSGDANALGIISVDLNQDGNMDIVTVHDYSNTINYFPGTGQGTFNGRSYQYTANGPATLSAADVDGDGFLDIIVPAQYAGGLTISRGSASGLGTPTNYSGFNAPYGAAAGDYDGDGKTDIAITYSGSNGLQILRGTGAGVLAGPIVLSSPQSGPYALATTDFNNDNKADFLVLSGYSGAIVAYAGDGAGHFATPTVTLTQAFSYGFAARDFNGDGNVDVAVASNSNNVVAVHFGNGGGAFAAPSLYPVGSGARELISADFNADGRYDIAVSTTASNFVSILLNQGGGVFTSNPNAPTGATPRGLTSCDLNNDGITDIVVANNGTNTISYLKGLGSGLFAAPVNYTVQSGPLLIATGDLNNDGYTDVVATNSTGQSVSVLVGSASGSLSTATNIAVPQQPYPVQLVDIDNDGVLDIVVGYNTSSGNLGLALGNGDATFGAFSKFSSGVYSRCLTTGDFDGNGQLDLVVCNDQANTTTVLMNTTCH